MTTCDGGGVQGARGQPGDKGVAGEKGLKGQKVCCMYVH